MFSLLRNRFGIPGVISVVALVFAMFGGAYAATQSGVHHKKTKVVKGPRGPKGKTGKAGPAGPAGPQGPAGSAGAKGETGAKGDTGPRGEQGEQGQQGEQGVPGDPWTAGGTLPSGATETGSFAQFVKVEAFAPITFAIPLEAALPSTNVHLAPNANCLGTVADPQAAAGHLCVYVGKNEGGASISAPIPSSEPAYPPANNGADKAGAFLQIGGAEAAVWGTWAVTAP